VRELRLEPRHLVAQVGLLADEARELLLHALEEDVDLDLVVAAAAETGAGEQHVVDVGRRQPPAPLLAAVHVVARHADWAPSASLGVQLLGVNSSTLMRFSGTRASTSACLSARTSSCAPLR
jgi:hypothetical protein